MRILLVGASGLIGTAVTHRADGAHDVRRLVRRVPHSDSEYRWDPASGVLPPEALEWADAVISLSGASLSRLPWTSRYRAEIRRSRVQTTEAIARGIAAAASPPAAWVSASAVGFYGDRPAETLTEESAGGTGFLADVVGEWEAATDAAHPHTRVVNARTGLVLAGALRPLLITTRLGLGAQVGDGRQHWPWIGLDDEARALLHLATDSATSGPVNLVAPTRSTARDVSRALARGMHRPHLFVLPRFVLRAALGRAADELLLADQAVEPRVLLTDGFTFEQPTIDEGVRALLSARRAEA